MLKLQEGDLVIIIAENRLARVVIVASPSTIEHTFLNELSGGVCRVVQTRRIDTSER